MAMMLGVVGALSAFYADSASRQKYLLIVKPLLLEMIPIKK